MTEEKILLAHGSGGKLSHELVEGIMVPAFANDILAQMHDAAQFPCQAGRLAFTTDSFVVKPPFFPGGDIGKLAVCGTVNDLAMAGAAPAYLSAAFIIEEGFLTADLRRIAASMGRTAAAAGIKIVTGDTKVVEKGAVDGIYINTAGVGFIPDGVDINPRRARPGQRIILNGYLGDHSLAVMGERHGLTLPEEVVSDCAPLGGLVREILSVAPDVAVLRDPTRGGLATALNEIAQAAGVGILIDETALPIRPAVAAVCDILGLDPLYMANEGKVLVFVENDKAEEVLMAMRRHHLGRDSRIIGEVAATPAGQVGLRTAIGGVRLLDMLVDDQLPRIC